MALALGELPEQSLWRYRQPLSHEAVSALISRHSTNAQDIRAAFLAGRELGHVREVLELGCGFGFMAGWVAARIHPEGRITGVDACADNRGPFEVRVKEAGRLPLFVRDTVGGRLPWPDGSFDLVVASHSLYYFVEAVPEIARVLRPGGSLLAVTHTQASCRALCRLVGVEPERSLLVRLMTRFGAENGEELLRPSFGEVERIDYANSLHFEAGEVEDLLQYLRFKFRFLNEWPESEPELFESGLQDLRARVLGRGEITLAKDDAAFWCRV
jgi:SAM-dependent methyltransferase